MKREVLRLEQVCLCEQGMLYLEDFSLHICEGEIVGLLPVDSHGLSALITLLKENTEIQRGYVYYRGKLVNSCHNPGTVRNRIGVVQRESALVDDLTVAENIFVLRQGFRAYLVLRNILQRELQPFLEEVGVQIAASTYVDKLPVFERCVVEILKAIVGGCRLIVLSELHTVVSETELEKLHDIMRHFTEKGFSFLYVSFHMEELSHLCDRVAAMDHGRMIKILQPDRTQLQCANAYFQLAQNYLRENKQKFYAKEPVFVVKNLHSGQMHHLSFCVSPGECVVLQDVKNCMLTDFLAVLKGEILASEGTMSLQGAAFSPKICRDVAIVEDRPYLSMLFREMSYLDNLCFTMDHRLPFLWTNPFLRKGLQKACVERFGDDLFHVNVKKLTRVQQYDLVYRRILLQNPKVVFCIQPFRGADMELRMHIFNLLQDLLHKGIAVVILAVNLADSLSLADKLIRVYGDAPDGVYQREDFAQLPFAAPFIGLYREESSK